MGRRCSVNQAVLWIGLLWGCHLGRPPAPGGGFLVAEVRAPFAEPGLQDAVHQGLTEALARAHSLGGRQAIPVRVSVVQADTRTTAIGGAQRVYTARLEIEVFVAERHTALSAERAFAGGRADRIAAARAAAFAALARTLSEDAVAWMRYAPSEGESGP